MNIETLPQRIAELTEYGPIQVTTRCEDVPEGPSIRRCSALPADEDQRPHVIIGDGALYVDQREATVELYVDTVQEGRMRLSLEDVEHVQIDHSFGDHMPLHGQNVMSLSVYDEGGIFVPRWRSHATEFDYNDVVESQIHPDYPGIGVIKSYDVSDAPDTRHISLEDAKPLGGHCMTFLVSIGELYSGSNSHTYNIITSRMGYSTERPLTVRPPSHPTGVRLKHVEMLDVPAKTTDEALLERHKTRLYKLNPKYQYPSALPRLKQMEVDAVFLYISSD